MLLLRHYLASKTTHLMNRQDVGSKRQRLVDVIKFAHGKRALV